MSGKCLILFGIPALTSLMEVAEAMGVDEYMVFRTHPMQIRFKNGSLIIFKGMDKPAKLKSLNGVSIVWVEECSEVKVCRV